MLKNLTDCLERCYTEPTIPVLSAEKQTAKQPKRDSNWKTIEYSTSLKDPMYYMFQGKI